MIPASEWRWHGSPGHLIVAPKCCYHLHTTVGAYRVSTIGCYHPASDALRQRPPEEIGCGRLYETMVFKNGPDGEPDEWMELDSDVYNDQADAERGHRTLCEKWAELATLEVAAAG